MKFRTQILGSFLICITLSFILLMANLQRQIVDINHTMTEDFNNQLISLKAEEIGNWLLQRITEMRIMSESEEFKRMDWEDTKPYVERLNKKLQQDYGNPAESFGIVDLQGQGWIHEELTIDVSQRPYFLEALRTEEEYVISRPVISKSDHMPIVLICYPIYNLDGEKSGFINGSLSVQKIVTMAEGISLYDGTGFVLDDNGDLFGSVDAPNPLFTDENFEMAKNSTKQITTIQDESGKRHMAFLADIPYSKGWRFGVVVSEDAVHRQTNELIRSAVLIWLAVLFLAVAVSIMISRGLTRPLAELEHYMKEVENGNLSVRFPVKGKNEFSRIGLGFNRMLEQIQMLLEQVYREQKEKRSMELQVLQSQINPHFLYNTLDTIRFKVYGGDTAAAVSMIDALADFFRISLNRGNEIISLKEEVEQVTRYLFIQQVRYEEKLDYGIHYDEELADVRMIKLLLQPLVENAIYHGIKPSAGKCYIDIDIYREDGDVILVVEDDGVGMETERFLQVREALKNRSNSAGYGLYNINERVVLTYGSGFGVTMERIEPHGTRVILRIGMQIPTEQDERGGTGHEGLDC